MLSRHSRLLSEKKCTDTSLVPTMLYALLEESTLSTEKTSSLVLDKIGGAAVSAADVRLLSRRPAHETVHKFLWFD